MFLPRTPIKKSRSKPRPGRLKGKKLKSLREECYERDQHCCVICGMYVVFDAPGEWVNRMHMAHVKGKRMFGDSLGNVQTECGDCHRKYHQNGPSREKIVPSK